jgi:molybdate transport system substrate-binding protein
MSLPEPDELHRAGMSLATCSSGRKRVASPAHIPRPAPIPCKEVTFSYAASSAVAKQIESGAPADLFASANPKWANYLQEKGLIRPETRKNLLGNSLVLIAAAAMKDDLKIAPGFPLAAAIGDSRLAMGTPGAVPAGTYAKAALTSLGIWDQAAPHIAGAATVRAALALVARGEAKYGIVYRTDASAEKAVRIVDTFPADSHPPIIYPFAVTTSSTNPDTAAFMNYLSSPPAARIFETEGFTVLP